MCLFVFCLFCCCCCLEVVVVFVVVVVFQATHPGGSIVMVGRGSFDVTIPYTIAATKEVDIRGVLRYANW